MCGERREGAREVGFCETCAECHKCGDKGFKVDMVEHEDGNYYCEEHDDTGVAWFNRKYPNASCNTCDKKLDGDSVVMCGGGGGECETWYCSECHNPDGNDDCEVCKTMNQ